MSSKSKVNASFVMMYSRSGSGPNVNGHELLLFEDLEDLADSDLEDLSDLSDFSDLAVLSDLAFFSDSDLAFFSDLSDSDFDSDSSLLSCLLYFLEAASPFSLSASSFCSSSSSSWTTLTSPSEELELKLLDRS